MLKNYVLKYMAAVLFLVSSVSICGAEETAPEVGTEKVVQTSENNEVESSRTIVEPETRPEEQGLITGEITDSKPEIKKNMGLEMPSCDNELLKNQVLDEIKNFYNNRPAASLREKRAQKLLLKNLSSFEEISVDDFKPEENYNVADRLVMLKMNDNMTNKDMRLCVSNKSGKRYNIYLLIYPKDNYYNAEIINFIVNQSQEDLFYVIYE